MILKRLANIGSMTNDDRHSVTVLGLGAMGSALARTLVEHGHTTTVWNRSPDKAKPFVAQGAQGAANVGEAVMASPVTIVCVVDDAALRGVLDLAGEALSGRVLVNLTNGTPDQARRTAARVAELGAAGYVDGGIMAVPPMIGTPEALVLYSGSRDAFGPHRPVLETFGSARYLGADPGLAALYDLALLSGMYGMFGGVLHSVALTKSAGVPATEFIDLLIPWLEAMASSLPQLARQVDADDHPTDSPLAMQSAGFPNLVEASRAQGVRPDLVLPMQGLIAEGVAAGHGAEDISSLVQLLDRTTGERLAVDGGLGQNLEAPEGERD
jgi:3-hydroxyisobutyrate dehydrogenase-like beta-hydroxyacid dehydrogenase